MNARFKFQSRLKASCMWTCEVQCHFKSPRKMSEISTWLWSQHPFKVSKQVECTHIKYTWKLHVKSSWMWSLVKSRFYWPCHWDVWSFKASWKPIWIQTWELFYLQKKICHVKLETKMNGKQQCEHDINELSSQTKSKYNFITNAMIHMHIAHDNIIHVLPI